MGDIDLSKDTFLLDEKEKNLSKDSFSAEGLEILDGGGNGDLSEYQMPPGYYDDLQSVPKAPHSKLQET